MWFYVQELRMAQPAVVLVLKRLRRRGNGFKTHPTNWEKPGIEPATSDLQDIGLSPFTTAASLLIVSLMAILFSGEKPFMQFYIGRGIMIF